MQTECTQICLIGLQHSPCDKAIDFLLGLLQFETMTAVECVMPFQGSSQLFLTLIIIPILRAWFLRCRFDFSLVPSVPVHAYKRASIRHALQKASTDSHHQDQARGNPHRPLSFLFSLGEWDARCLGPRCSLFLEWCRNCFHHLRCFLFSFLLLRRAAIACIKLKPAESISVTA